MLGSVQYAGGENEVDRIERVDNRNSEDITDINNSEKVHSLIQVLMGNDDGRTRADAAMSLGEIGDASAIEPLIKALNDKDDRVRVGAAVALGRICDAKTVNPLIEALNDSVSMVRQLAAFSLSRIGDPRAVNPLIEALDDE
ncbi:MAG: HEAT repeat domain-containing protein [Methanothrix sp.]|jgi:FOG: HEAT repeat|uniref:Alpha-Rep4 n=1 Tax=Methanothrix harundinacea TaxID=301375 RepID=A0A124G383_9EURY|nr:MAG: Alpha-Rep4 [Methanothrix harundinacea]MDD2639016.1 HEAT repeat domain-containing protein [Methanothrix sp.]MDI9399943.1 HEAT repeat domain-containing protein [Euryarchaeota archaeon]KUK96130.1 MAG: Alpha-Rep4 [Methanothrix harundinacea]MCP1392010.1 HEAT repeat domain-containing protein [Methanothrix harundinacea]